ncbi:hypothetical protein [Micromonospora sp. NBC_01813]|uniref:hypothetical protein n=1 Tax=Micromonospora sp. NBC_01813 TaxID=2975988 RepID=UPI002DD7A77E|nr:hypothetical protein [Micromonospora sp. NBC_01813]WSA10622.1 hypothetical protein OG958_07525 [Micromonospora sp. NBC_01813]
MDPELFPERAVHRPGPIITGHVVRLVAGYSRPIKVGQPVLIGVLAAAGVIRTMSAALSSVRLAGSGSTAARRKWKELRTGPEYLVTPLHIRDTNGVLCEMEIHGHVPQSALDPADHVQVTVRRQKDPELPPRVERIVNLTTGQFLTPRTPTLRSHLGPALLFQAVLGVLALIALVAVVIMLR